MLLTQCDFYAEFRMSQRGEKLKKTRTNDRSNHDPHEGTHVSTSALNVKVMEIETSAATRWQ